MNDFEEKVFRPFVLQFGGELIPESTVDGEKRADYLFRPYRVIAELKTLDKDARADHAKKVQTLVSGWMRDRRILIYGRVNLELAKLRPDLRREWLAVLERPVEAIVRKAQRQIRSGKQFLGMKDAKGLLIIANDGNLLYTSPSDYMAVVARVLRKRAGGMPRFPEIQAVLYIARGQWCYGCDERAPQPEIERLQQDLVRAWRTFLPDSI